MICAQSLALGTPRARLSGSAPRGYAPRRTTRKPATRSPPAWKQDRPGGCAISTSVPSEPLTGPAQRGLSAMPTSSGHRDDHDRSGHRGGRR